MVANGYNQLKAELALCDRCYRWEVQSRQSFERFGIAQMS